MSKRASIVGWIIIFIIVAWMGSLYAAEWGAPTGINQARVATPPETYVTLLDASPYAATGMSTARDLGMTPTETKCMVILTGTAPTSWTVAFYSGPTSATARMTTQYPVGSTQSDTITSFPFMKSFTGGYGDRWWKVSNISTVGGDATTKYTVTCTGMK